MITKRQTNGGFKETLRNCKGEIKRSGNCVQEKTAHGSRRPYSLLSEKTPGFSRGECQNKKKRIENLFNKFKVKYEVMKIWR